MALKCQGTRSEGNAAAIAIPVHGDDESLGNFGSRALSLSAASWRLKKEGERKKERGEGLLYICFPEASFCPKLL